MEGEYTVCVPPSSVWAADYTHLWMFDFIVDSEWFR